MNKHRREVSIEILVGLFMFTVLIALGVFTIVLSRENLLKQAHQYEFVFNEIGGLRDGDNVFLRGMNVGRVKQTTLEQGRVRVFVTLDVPLQLRKGYSIEVVDASMLGGKNLKIYEGPDENEPLGENMTILGEPPVDMIQELGKAVRAAEGMIASVERGEGTLGKLLRDDEMYLVVREMMDNMNQVVAQVSRGEGTVGKLLMEDDVYTDVSVLMSNARMLSDRIAAGEGTLGALMTENDQLYDDLSATMVAVRDISESINAGEGTLGKLVRDAKLYNETTSLVEDVRAAVDDLREASPITSFGSVIFGAF